MQGWDVATIVRFPPGARMRPADLGDGVAKATYRFQVSPLPLPSQAQADEVADTPELRAVCFRSKQGGAAALNHKPFIWCCCHSRVSSTCGMEIGANRSSYRRT